MTGRPHIQGDGGAAGRVTLLEAVTTGGCTGGCRRGCQVRWCVARVNQHSKAVLLSTGKVAYIHIYTYICINMYTYTVKPL